MKKIAILGSTGSIGKQTLDVLNNLNDEFEVYSLSTYSDLEIIIDQIKKFKPRLANAVHKETYQKLEKIAREEGFSTEITYGTDGLLDLVRMDEIDIVVNAVVGAAGLLPGLEALEHKKRLCSANKESLVIGGNLMRNMLKKGGELIPIDSEHSALLQASLSGRYPEIKNLILTASGGPFWGTGVDFSKVSIEETLAHPNWSMGKKISVDSATMMNKGLEVIEARWLFDIQPENIKVLIHPESIVHSIVEFVDNSQIAQLSVPDMKLPIQYALTYPERMEGLCQSLDLSKISELHFHEPDHKRFPCLRLAYEALHKGGSFPVVLNAANEAAVQLFLEKRINLARIPEIVERVLERHTHVSNPSIDTILQIDHNVKREVIELNKLEV
ncbi:1-deoxy-D-xylulose-5-phosphate reductoisomerase [bacterium]|nr:1-deoxy-D-xylulose-5-phosphate reductoisomerase [bacterium]